MAVEFTTPLPTTLRGEPGGEPGGERQQANDRCIRLKLPPVIYHEVYQDPHAPGWRLRASATVVDVLRPREIEIQVGSRSDDKPDAEAVLRSILTLIDHELREQLGLEPHTAKGARAEAAARFKREGKGYDAAEVEKLISAATRNARAR